MDANKPRRPSQFRGTWWVNPNGYSVQSGLEETNLGMSTSLMDGKSHHGQPTNASPYRDAPEKCGLPDTLRIAEGQWLVAHNMGFTIAYDPDCVREYNPLAVKALHRHFAATDCSEAGVLSFANTYGFLGDDIRVLEKRWSSRHAQKEYCIGEELVTWYAQIRSLSFLIAVWDVYRDPMAHPDALRDYLKIDRDNGNFYFNSPDASIMHAIAHSFRISLYRRFPDDYVANLQVKQAARLLLEYYISNSLTALTIPSISLAQGSQITLVPANLLGAIYIQFAQEAMGRADQMTRCIACGKWFVSKHASRKFCGDACKMKAYRRGRTNQTANGD